MHQALAHPACQEILQAPGLAYPASDILHIVELGALQESRIHRQHLHPLGDRCAPVGRGLFAEQEMLARVARSMDPRQHVAQGTLPGQRCIVQHQVGVLALRLGLGIDLVPG